MGQSLSRRQLLRRSALVAATFPAAKVGLEGWSLAADAQELGLAVPMNLELVTVTDTSMTVTWHTADPTDLDEFRRPRPVAAPGRLLLGTDPLALEEVESHGPTAYHHVEVTGLEPGTRYFYRAESDGVPATGVVYDLASLHPLYGLLDGRTPSLGEVDPTNGLTFTTLVPPPGEVVLRFAWFNDMHFGEKVAGIVTGDLPEQLFPTGFPPGLPVDPDSPYWRVCGNASLEEAAARGADFLIVNGDLTNEAEPEALAEIRAALERFGTVGGAPGSTRRTADGSFAVSKGDRPGVWVTRGNHDRVHAADSTPTDWKGDTVDYSGGTRVPEAPDQADTFFDVFGDSFEDPDPSGKASMASHFSLVADTPTTRWRFVGIDSNDPVDGTGVIADTEIDYLRSKLELADEPTFVLVHHPMYSEQQGFLVNVPAIPELDGVKPASGGDAFVSALADHRDSVVGVHHGHTHRNHRGRDDLTGALPFYEGGSSKEYPVGFTLVTLYEGGYMVNFHKASDPDALAWSEASRAEFYGAVPFYLSGALADRNWVVDVDARRVSSRPTDPPVADPGGALPSTVSPAAAVGDGPVLPATGGGALLSGAGALTAVAAEATRRLAAREAARTAEHDAAG